MTITDKYIKQYEQKGLKRATRVISITIWKLLGYPALLSFIFLLLLLVGCSSINEKEAEAIAKVFVKNHVKFYAKTSNQSVDITTYDLKTVGINKQGNRWNVILNVSAKQGASEKKGLLFVVVDAKKRDVVNLKRLG